MLDRIKIINILNGVFIFFVHNVFSNNVKNNSEEYKNKKETLKMPKSLSLDHTITYEPNQVLIYNSSLLHNASIKEKYTHSSPRTTLRLFFSCDSIINTSTTNYFKYH